MEKNCRRPTKNPQEPALLCSNCTTFAWNHHPQGPQTWHVRSFSSPAACRWKELFFRRSCSFKLIKWWLRHRSRPMIYSFNPNHPPLSSNITQFWAMMRWRKRKKKRRPMTASVPSSSRDNDPNNPKHLKPPSNSPENENGFYMILPSIFWGFPA